MATQSKNVIMNGVEEQSANRWYSVIMEKNGWLAFKIVRYHIALRNNDPVNPPRPPETAPIAQDKTTSI